jgi:methylenetetrahydrofolate dehydrogenase (NADP+) / methenyltetrahydrofolate cyclohydrolase
MAASRISAAQKIRNLSWLGLDTREVVLPGDVAERELAGLIARLNDDPLVTAIIVQLPAPERLRDHVQEIAPAKDVDGLLGDRSLHPSCATADGVARLVAAHSQGGPSVAVVGARGFVGGGVARLLRKRGLEVTGRAAAVLGHRHARGSPASNGGHQCRHAGLRWGISVIEGGEIPLIAGTGANRAP